MRKMKIFKKCAALFVSVCLAFSGLSSLAAISLEAQAATFDDINQSSVFVKQQESNTCTLAANVMLLRRTAMMNGASDWSSITESAARSTLWYEGVGMYHNYTYAGITVSYAYVSSSSSSGIKSELISLLEEHPEGIVIYDYDIPHAVLLTDYTDGVFYCADPANNVASGRIAISNSSVQIANVDSYWYVVTPDVTLDDDSTSSDDSDDDDYEIWQITATSGVNLRSGAGTSYSIYTAIPYGTKITVTDKATANGYTWGYTTYNGYSGWCVLDYAQLVSSSSTSLTNNSTISATSITLGTSLTLTGAASGGTSPYYYSFIAKLSTASDFTTLRGYSTTSTKTWTPSSTGTYTVRIKVKDASGTIVSKTFTVTVTKSSSSLKNSSTISATSVGKGTAVTLTGAASGGSGTYQYYMTAQHSTASSATVLQGYSTTSTKTWTPSSTGTYTVQIKVKDSSGTVATKTFTLTVTGLTNSSTISATSVGKGTAVTLTGAASGGSGTYQYYMTAQHSTASSATVLQGYSTTSTKTWTPSSTGTYTVQIKVKDSSGTVAIKTFTLTVTSS